MPSLNKKVIQVPMESDLLESLDRLSQSRHQSRSELIREACRRYIEALEKARLDEAYAEGYRRQPESPALGEAQVALLGQILEEESW